MKNISSIIACSLFVVFLYIYGGPLSDVLAYHEQHHLFLFTAEYFHRTVASEGLLGFVANFIIQFFYYPLLGAALMALILVMIYIAVNAIFKAVARDTEKLQLAVIPTLLLLVYTQKTSHSIIPLVICLISAWSIAAALFILRKKTKLFPLLKREFITSRKAGILVPAICIALYAATGYALFVKKYDYKEGIMLKTEHYAKNNDWQKVKEYTERYLATGKTNQFIAYFHTLALYNLGEMPYGLFSYPPYLGVKTIYIPWNGDSRECEYGHYVYEQLGLINEAMRWEFESMVVWGETAPHLINLARYNIAAGREKIAQMYINKLRQSLFYREEADRLESYSKKGNVPGLRNPLRHVTDRQAKFINVMNIGPDLEYLLQYDSQNRMAFEYLMSQLLLSNHIIRFAHDLKHIRNFGYKTLPPAYEEALLVYKMGVSREEFDKCGFTISPETENRFAQYYRLVQSGDMQSLKRNFGNTYWFYINYVSPYGNRVINQQPASPQGTIQL